MRYATVVIGLAFSVFNVPSLCGGEATVAGFIPPESRAYFPFAGRAQYWGAEESGWHLALQTPVKTRTFVDGGGYGETIPLSITIFTSDSDWHRWSIQGSFSIRLTAHADGMKDYVRTAIETPDNFNANSFGTGWQIRTDVSIEELRQHWGTLPEAFTVQATLSEKGLPTVESATAPLALISVSLADATLKQKLASLTKGQSRSQITKMLGTPSSYRTITKTKMKPVTVLVYPNPDAPADLPSAKRNTEIYLDSDGGFVRYFHTWLGC